ncbi:MAG: hypothetical protein ABI369_02675 [Acetobacteraceae bacterium]
MTLRSKTTTALAFLALLAGGATSGARAQQPTSSGQQAPGPSGWTFNAAPYLWLPNLDTKLNYNLPPALDGRLRTDLSVGPGQIVSHLNFATAFAADAQHGPFSLLTDFMYLNLSATNAHFRSIDFVGLPSQPISRSVQTSTGTRLGSTLWTLAGGYTVLRGDWGNLDVIAGFRYLGVNATTDYSLALTVTGPRGNGATFGGVGGISGSGAIWNGIGGVRGRIRLGHTGLFIPYYFDAGAGGSNLTWQVASGLGYQTGWAGVSLTYRYLSLDQGSSGVVQRLSLGGPMMMVDFSF